MYIGALLYSISIRASLSSNSFIVSLTDPNAPSTKLSMDSPKSNVSFLQLCIINIIIANTIITTSNTNKTLEHIFKFIYICYLHRYFIL